MKLKKFFLVLCFVFIGMLFVGCDRDNNPPTNNKPEIHGANDITIEKGTNFKPLEGVTATDVEDGDLTASITYSGNVKPNVVGEYTAEYKVVDSDDNLTVVIRKVNVVLTDLTAPFMTGVNDTEIVVGDTTFALRAGVEANDTIDGDLTSAITVTGNFDPWKLGTYPIDYSVKDNSNNEKKVTRNITVSEGNFVFLDAALTQATVAFTEGAYEATLSSGQIDGVLANYALAKMTFKAVADAESQMTFTLTNGTTQENLTIGTTLSDYVVYFRISEAFTDGKLTLNVGTANITITDLVVKFGEARDEVLPTITFPEGTIVVPKEVTDAAVIKKFILTGVSANDNIDGIISSKLDVDLSEVTLGEYTGLKQITIFVLDTSNNRAEATRYVEFAKSYSTNFITDPTFESGDASQFGLNGGAGSPVIDLFEGTLRHRTTVDANPGWDSASSPRLESTTDFFRQGNYYLLKFDVKAEKARKMSIRIGLDTTEAAGWIENFAGASNTPFSLTTNWQTVYVIFYVHAERSTAANSNVVKMEFKIGTFDWSSAERLNTVSFDNMQFYLLSNENTAPELKLNEELPTTFGKNETMPDFTQYITAYDQEDASSIAITASHINSSAVKMDQAGEYDVIYTVGDSAGKTATYTLRIKVLETKDETAPALTEKEGLVKTVDQFSDPIDLLTAVVANDLVDGNIAITSKMVTGSVNVNVAGTYEVTYTVKDSSGNSNTLTITFVVNDKEGPKFTGNTTVTVTVGDNIDVTKLVTVKDNVDGDMTVALSNVSGYAAFIADNIATTAGTFDLVYTITDAAGNEGTYTVKVTVNPKGETMLVEDVVATDILARKPAMDSGSTSMATVVYDETTGHATIDITNIGGWFSAVKMKITIPQCVSGEIYKVKITVKADQARTLKFVAGQALWASPWYDKFTILEGTEIFAITNEFATYEMMFKYDKPSRDGGPTLEFDFGKDVHPGNIVGNDIYITKFEIVKMKEVPVEDVAIDILAKKPGIDSGSASNASIVYDETTGAATISVTNVGTYFSATKIKVPLTELVMDKTYNLKITIKADQARSIKFNIGQALWASPWFDKFTILEGTDIVEISDQYVTYYLKFKYDKALKDGGPTVEFNFGKDVHPGNVAGNSLYITEFKILNVTEEAPAPTETLALDILASKPAIDSGSSSMASVVYDQTTGAGTISITDVGGWISAAKMKISLSTLTQGETYKLKITVKADQARSLKFNIGQALWADPWMNKFTYVTGTDLITITDQFVTYELTFTYDKAFQDGGPIIEFCFGKGDHAGDIVGNNVYINEFKVMKLS